ncbi:hypothetical protein L083_5361 [Actinoplanes sp. N902-109]|nr:hypothetical protein L083_5361 [Actinoplanes sp. N902-109]
MQIDVDQRAMAVVRHLRGSPEEVFARPAGGYLLLMATEFSAPVTAWLRQHIATLDAAAGSDVAVAVFASTFTVPVGIPGSPARRPGRPCVLLAEVQDGGPGHGAVRRLVNRGRLGLLAEHDELTLGTPGTARTARTLGVGADLPCLVVADALPGEHVAVIPLPGAAGLETLAQVVRSAVRTVTRSPGLGRFLVAAHELARTEQRVRAAETEVERLTGRLETMRGPEAAAEPIRWAYAGARHALSTGATRRFTTVLRGIWHPPPEKLIRAAGRHAAERRAELLRTDRTARTLAYYLRQFSWPMPEPQRSAYRRVLDRYVLPFTTGPSGEDDPGRCESLIAALRARNTAIVETVLGTALPPLGVLVADARNQQLSTAARVVDELHDAIADLETARLARLRQITVLAATDPPSLSTALRAAACRAGLTVLSRPIGDFTGAFTGAALSPQTLQEVTRARLDRA